MPNLPDIIYNPNTRERVEPGEKYILETLAQSPLEGWTIFEQPNLNGDKPDIVMIHPNRGVIIIEVKDYELTSGNYRPVAEVLGTNGQWIQKSNPVEQVKRYQKEIQLFCSKHFVDILEEHNQDKRVFGIIETAVYFHHAPQEVGRRFCGNPDTTRILDRSHLEAIKCGDWQRSGLNTLKYATSKIFTPDQIGRFVTDLETWLKPSSYQLERTQPIQLMPDQKNHAKPTPGIHRRLRGVAGSGKTLVLATRAAHLLEENQRVLVVPFNITLKHYIRDSVSQQYQGEDRKKIRTNLVIRHFHDLLKMIASAYDIKLENPSDSPDKVLTNVWHNQVIQCLNQQEKIDERFRFDAILVDEGQDYCQGWVELLLMLLKERDEFLICYDNVQDIYERKAVWIEEGDKIVGLGFRGRPADLKITRRVPGPMIKVAQEFAQTYNLQQSGEILVPQQWEDMFVTIEWKNVIKRHANSIKTHSLSNQVWNQVHQFMADGVSPDDITILVTNQDSGAEIVQRLKAENMKVCHVFDETGKKDYEVRREEKWKFQPGTGKIKVCTVHSYKGWESTHLILLLDQNVVNRHSLIYVALTRFKHPVEGAFSHFTCLNFDPTLNAVKDIFIKYGNEADDIELQSEITEEPLLPWVHGEDAEFVTVPSSWGYLEPPTREGVYPFYQDRDWELQQLNDMDKRSAQTSTSSNSQRTAPTFHAFIRGTR